MSWINVYEFNPATKKLFTANNLNNLNINLSSKI
jgi:hypothetical protein